MAGTVRWMVDRHDGEASAEQRMSGVGYLDLLGRRIERVLKGGIVLLSRLTTWITATCGSFFNFGCVMACCYA